MKQILLCSFLIAIWAIQAHCFVAGNPNNDIHQSEPTLLGKIKNKAGEIAENVYHRGEEAVETIKYGYHETKCRLHQLAAKVKPHEHEQDPCSGHHQDYEEPNVDVHKNHNGENHAGYQNGQQIGKRLETPDTSPIQTDQGKIDVRAGSTSD